MRQVFGRLLPWLAIVLMAGLSSCHRGAVLPQGVVPAPGGSPAVRVRLVNGPGPLAVGSESGVLLFSDLVSGEKIAAINPGEQWDIVLFGPESELRISSPEGRVSRPHPDGIRASVPGGGIIKLAGRQYRGQLIIYNSGGGRMMVVNRLPLEDYLRSVVPAEIGSPGNAAYQAMKAQAVSARSYAMALMAQNRSFSFDLTADTGDQVYRGVASETQLADGAVFETAGECLSSGGRVVTSFYHSTCGGRTAEPEEAWGEDFARRNDWLRSVSDGSFDQGSQWAEWEVSWSRQQLLLLLKKSLPATVGLTEEEIGEPTDIEVMSKGPSGRNVLLKVTTDKRVLQVAGDNIRRALRKPDGGILPSTMFDLALERGGASGIAIVARGRGFGHGLGMCQTGAIARSSAGHDYRRILDHYFPRADISKLY